MSEASRVFFEKVLPCVVIKLRYLWLLWFLALTVFRSSHPFERYDADFKKLFMFERVQNGEDLHMPITIIWGALAAHLLPEAEEQSFVFQSEEQDFTSCFMETFKQWMENQDCDEASALYPCCSLSAFPYRQEVFELCIKRAIMELDRNTMYHLDSKTPGPRFDINDTIRAIVLEFPEHLPVHAGLRQDVPLLPQGGLTGSARSCSAHRPASATAGSSATWSSTTSGQPTVRHHLHRRHHLRHRGLLVLLGWELNVLESVTISVAVGLSVDFDVHYGVAYRWRPSRTRGEDPLPKKLQCQALAEGTASIPSPQGKTGMGLGGTSWAGGAPWRWSTASWSPGVQSEGGGGAVSRLSNGSANHHLRRPRHPVTSVREGTFPGPCLSSEETLQPGPQTLSGWAAHHLIPDHRPGLWSRSGGRSGEPTTTRSESIRAEPESADGFRKDATSGPRPPHPCQVCGRRPRQPDYARPSRDHRWGGGRPLTSAGGDGVPRTLSRDTPPTVPDPRVNPAGHGPRGAASEPAASPRKLGCFKRRLKVKSPDTSELDGGAAPLASRAAPLAV
ncbi:unnamed protein product [Lota lota]